MLAADMTSRSLLIGGAGQSLPHQGNAPAAVAHSCVPRICTQDQYITPVSTSSISTCLASSSLSYTAMDSSYFDHLQPGVGGGVEVLVFPHVIETRLS
jgi:hypothetical protein